MSAFLTVNQVADKIGVHANTIYKLAQTFKIPHIRVTPRTYRFRDEEIEAWLRRRTVRDRQSYEAVLKDKHEPRME